MEKEAIKFIDRLYRDLYLSDEVLHHSTGNKTDKYKNIKEYLDMLSELHERASISDNRKEMLKKLYHDKYVIKREDIPESYYEHQQEMALERGYGHVRIGKNERHIMEDQIINDQEKSLDVWLDYFLSDDAKVYPFWAKYWAFQGMLKLGTYNKEQGTFNRRTKDTTSIFADLNREALALSIDMMIKVLNKESLDDKELEIVVKGGSFQRIYTYILNKTLSNNDNIIKRNEGIWVKYYQGTNHMPLVNSLQGYNTGWCTAGASVAHSQLSNGDFYVYYTLDENGEYKVPRIAIRMQGNEIGEIRGVAKNQNLEPEMEDVVNEKLKEFPAKDKYCKRVNDMKKLTAIYKANKEKKELSVDDLKFIYEIDDKITGFGYHTDPRIIEITSWRNKLDDFAKIFNCQESEITDDVNSIKPSTKILCGNYIARYLYDISDYDRFPEIVVGDIIFSQTSTANNVKFCKQLFGNIYMDILHIAKNITFPEKVMGSVYLQSLRTISNSTLPKRINGGLIMTDLIEMINTTLPEYVGSYLNMGSIQKLENVVFPKRVDAAVSLTYLISAKNVVFPEEIGDYLELSDLEEIDNVVFPKRVGGNLWLSKMKNHDRLVLPEEIGGNLAITKMPKIDGLKLPEKVGRSILLKRVQTMKNVTFQQMVYGDIALESLKSCENVILPKSVKGTVYLNELRKFKNLVLPEEIGGELNISSLRNYRHLVLPKTIEGSIVAHKNILKKYSLDELKEIVKDNIFLLELSDREENRYCDDVKIMRTF